LNYFREQMSCRSCFEDFVPDKTWCPATYILLQNNILTYYIIESLIVVVVVVVILLLWPFENTWPVKMLLFLYTSYNYTIWRAHTPLTHKYKTPIQFRRNGDESSSSSRRYFVCLRKRTFRIFRNVATTHVVIMTCVWNNVNRVI